MIVPFLSRACALRKRSTAGASPLLTISETNDALLSRARRRTVLFTGRPDDAGQVVAVSAAAEVVTVTVLVVDDDEPHPAATKTERTTQINPIPLRRPPRLIVQSATRG